MKPEYVKCPLCGNDNTADFCVSGNIRIVKCIPCGLLYQNPRVKYEEQDKLETYGSFNEQNTEGIERFYRHILAEIGKHKTSGELLDVGCARGGFLKVAGEAGYAASGVEIASGNIESARRYGNIHEGTLESARYGVNSFDVIVLRHVFEHVPEPLETLSELYRILKRGGIAYIEVPNERYFKFKVGHLTKIHPGLKEMIKSHLFYYTKETLKETVKYSQFKIAEEGAWGFSNRTFAEHSIDEVKRKNIIVRCVLGCLYATKADRLLGCEDSLYVILKK